MLHREESGSGATVVLVHGAWADARHWRRLRDELDGFRVVAYDRRGHGRSGGGHESIGRDVDDLAELIADAGPPAHVVAGSLGGSIALRLAAAEPELLASVAVHEPALAGLIGGGGEPPDRVPPAKAFAEASLGDGWWDRLTDDERAGFEDNGDVWLDELRDREAATLALDALARFERPVLITIGGESPGFWRKIAAALTDALPHATVDTIPGARHLPHLTHPREYAEIVRGFVSAAAAPR